MLARVWLLLFYCEMLLTRAWLLLYSQESLALARIWLLLWFPEVVVDQGLVVAVVPAKRPFGAGEVVVVQGLVAAFVQRGCCWQGSGCCCGTKRDCC